MGTGSLIPWDKVGGEHGPGHQCRKMMARGGEASDGAPQGAVAAVSLRQGLRAAQGPRAPAGAWAARGASWRGSAGGGRDGDPRVAPPGPPASACGPGPGPCQAASLPCPPPPPTSASVLGAGGAGGGCQGARRGAGVPRPGGAGGRWAVGRRAAPGWQRSRWLWGQGTAAIPPPLAPSASAAVPPGRPWAGVPARGALGTLGCRGRVGALLPAPGVSWRGAPGWPQEWAARGGPSHGPLRGAAAVDRGGGQAAGAGGTGRRGVPGHPWVLQGGGCRPPAALQPGRPARRLPARSPPAPAPAPPPQPPAPPGAPLQAAPISRVPASPPLPRTIPPFPPPPTFLGFFSHALGPCPTPGVPPCP